MWYCIWHQSTCLWCHDHQDCHHYKLWILYILNFGGSGVSNISIVKRGSTFSKCSPVGTFSISSILFLSFFNSTSKPAKLALDSTSSCPLNSRLSFSLSCRSLEFSTCKRSRLSWLAWLAWLLTYEPARDFSPSWPCC